MKKLLVLITMIFAFSSALSAELVVIVHPSSKLENISTKELEKIFLSKTQFLPSGERARPAELNSLELKTRFYEKVADKSEIELRKYWATTLFTGNGQPPKQFRASADILGYVKEHPGAIAYIDKNTVKDSVKVVAVIK
jgi:ABC-type phosphate transport system substrate-binding protein